MLQEPEIVRRIGKIGGQTVTTPFTQGPEYSADSNANPSFLADTAKYGASGFSIMCRPPSSLFG